MNNFLGQLRDLVGEANLLTEAHDTAAYLNDWRGNYRGKALAVIKPENTEQIAAIVKHCAKASVSIVPQGGNTGLVGGGIPNPDGQSLLLSLTRLNRIRAIDAANHSITAEAGVILQRLQQVADQAGYLFPLSLASEGSCTLGGNLSTNAGGTAVLRYGNTRELTLGLEVVTAQGEIWHGLRSLRKDNTGYDLKHCFIGAEGTLGIITAAVMKLFPKPQQTVVALVAVADPQAAVALLNRLSNIMGSRLVAFELISRHCVELVCQHLGATEPFTTAYPWQILIEVNETSTHFPLREMLENTLSRALEESAALDALIATSEAQSQALWRLREDISEAQRINGKNIKHDISVPISRIPEFITQCDRALRQAYPSITLVCFGHLGDGNLHYNCGLPDSGLSQAAAINRIVYDHVDQVEGSISAEHGLGQLKRLEILRHKSPIEIDLMRALKRALDPDNLMNPGKV
ncbi:MAG: FAD-binding oxidoreductase, partial [Betaproteobacteria bacterium]|nr:FAD-binding oxidoreductase [Betaproteobacteria bacterium]